MLTSVSMLPTSSGLRTAPKWVGIGLWISLLVTGCVTGPAAVKDPASSGWVRTELFFGLGNPPDGVSEGERGAFLDEVAAEYLPDGFTVLLGTGQWYARAERRARQIPSMVIIALHPDTPEASARIDRLREAWKERFGQRSVLRVTSPAEVSF